MPIADLQLSKAAEILKIGQYQVSFMSIKKRPTSFGRAL